MSKDYPWINEGGIDYVEVNNLVNPPNPANAGKVIGVGEDGKAALIEGGGGGGSSDVVIAKLEYDEYTDMYTITPNYSELVGAVEAGKTVLLTYDVQRDEGNVSLSFAEVFSFNEGEDEDFFACNIYTGGERYFVYCTAEIASVDVYPYPYIPVNVAFDISNGVVNNVYFSKQFAQLSDEEQTSEAIDGVMLPIIATVTKRSEPPEFVGKAICFYDTYSSKYTVTFINGNYVYEFSITGNETTSGSRIALV